MNTDFSSLKGETIRSIKGLFNGSDEVFFETDSGKTFKMWHSQDCCEHVRIMEVIGDPADIIEYEISEARESTNEGTSSDDTFTWTFYTLRTIEGSLDIRWLGESNGYYSESVDFEEVNEGSG